MPYTKREFLKIMGLGMVFMPFIGCFSENKEKPVSDNGHAESGKDSLALKKPSLEISDADVVLLYREDEAYARLNQGFNKRLHFLPKVIALCKTEKGIQYAVLKAKELNLKVAVKSGGHSFEGFSNNNGGMVINLSQMKKITWLDNNEVVIEPACLLQDIQAALFPKGRLLPSGSCGTVGIAGLTLGGGYGFFSRKYGFTCDSLLDFSMITAAGEIVEGSTDADLAWACKGGGNGNFGVVSSFKFRTYPMPKTFDSYVLKFRKLDVKRFEQTLHAWFDVSEKLPEEAFAAYVLNGSTLTVLVTNYKASPDFAAELQPLTSIADSVSPVLQADLPKAMKRYYGRKGPINFKNASAGLYRGKEDILTIKEALFNAVTTNSGIVFQINTLGGKVADAAFEQASCYPHRQLPYLGELQAYWDNESQESKLIHAFETIQTLFRNSGVTAHYRNYPDINFPHWEQSYYGNNYQRLQNVKSKYDAAEIFQYPQSIKPA